MDLQALFGNIDVYLFDQLLRGRLRPGMSVLDVGCGGGRNLVHLLQEGYDVHAVDLNPEAVAQVEALAAKLAPTLSPEQFIVAPAEKMPLPDARFDFVTCNALLHFADGEEHFLAMLREIARVLRPDGVFFARLMSTEGLDGLITPLGDGRHRLPAGQEVYLTTEEQMRSLTREVFHGNLLDPLKSTVVHGQRTMSTWIVERGN